MGEQGSFFVGLLRKKWKDSNREWEYGCMEMREEIIMLEDTGIRAAKDWF